MTSRPKTFVVYLSMVFVSNTRIKKSETNLYDLQCTSEDIRMQHLVIKICSQFTINMKNSIKGLLKNFRALEQLPFNNCQPGSYSYEKECKNH